MAAENDLAQSAEQAGIPQLDFSAFPNQIFWLVIFLVAIYLVVGRVAIPRIDSIITQRDRRIQNDLSDAREMSRSADRIQSEIQTILDEARRDAAESLAEARNDIQSEQQQTIEIVNARIEVEMAAATERIEGYQNRAPEVIRSVAKQTALEIVETFVPGRNAELSIEAATEARMERTEQ